MTSRRFLTRATPVALGLALAACAGQREVARVAPPPIMVAAPPPARPSLPPGATPGMTIPVRLADGSYPTPNRALSEAATLWHLRSALNVAALACRGAEEAGNVARYNALLTTHKKTLATAETRLSAEFKAGGGDWRDRYDDTMTRLYNFFSQTPARAGFCAAATQVLAESATVSDGQLGAFALAKLPELDRPFTDFYRAYDAWRTGSMTPVAEPAAPLVIATAAVAPTSAAAPVAAAPRVATPAPAPAPSLSAPSAPAPAVRTPRLEVDPAIFRME
ncbi:hypothetical protein [Sphingomonas carotinifaciens]|uniref:hypothetical protein n=1 Tax=Sphingomonas carotinifaciens TaxID=1166323 RepID=UPI001374FDA6|nr:hypothetical protein [Sphingomonas carotinifaciens]